MTAAASPPCDSETTGFQTIFTINFDRWLEDEPTGWGYEHGEEWQRAEGLFWTTLLRLYEPASEVPTEGPGDPGAGDMRRRAAALAAEAPHVAVAPPRRPALSGNLAEDVRAVCGVTWREIADVFGISERAVAGWRVQGVPRHRAQTMEALRAIGATLVGGLGPEGVREWLTGGGPSRLERLREGELEAVAAEAQSYRDTPAT